MDSPDPQTQTLSIPSLVAFALISILTIRYFFFTPTSPNSTTSSSTTFSSANTYPAGQSQSRQQTRRRNFPADRVDTVHTMFPQLSRRDIEFDLVMNGGSVQATTERVLRGGRLGAAPPNFTALYGTPPSSGAASNSTTSSANTRTQAQQQTYQDLISRYGLSDRIAAAASGAASGQKQGGSEGDEIQTAEKQKEKGGWTNNKADRQALLRKRREDMILAARRKLEEKDSGSGKGKERIP